MTDHPSVNSVPPVPPRASIAPLRTVRATMELVDGLLERSENMPGIGVVYGYASLGKTVAANYARNSTGAHLIEISEYWSRKHFAKNLLLALGYPDPKGTAADMVERAIRILSDDPTRPLIIDEADILLDKGMIGLVRDLHDKGQVPIILVGEEKLPEKLAKWDRVYDRILDMVAAQPCDLSDTAALARIIAPDLAIGEDVLDEIRRRTDGRARRIVTSLERLRHKAGVHGAEQLTLDLLDGTVAEGRLPALRRTPRVQRAA